MEAERFYLDNHIYDKLEADPEATAALASAIEAGRIELIRTYILEDELAGAPAPVQELAARFPHRDVHVAGTILGLWRIGQARLADREDIEAIRGNTQQGNEPHARDALHVNTARTEGATFVTEDTRLQHVGEREQLDVWSWATFREHLIASGA